MGRRFAENFVILSKGFPEIGYQHRAGPAGQDGCFFVFFVSGGFFRNGKIPRPSTGDFPA
jgi:hypothetical protein